MASSPLDRLTEEQYLALEEVSEEKHEFFDGEIFAMSGGTLAHTRIQGNLYRELATRLEGGSCEAFTSDLRIQVSRTGFHTYPDVSIVCGKATFADRKRTTLLNPIAVIEVLSPSTESYDRGKKFKNYREIESLRDYILVSQEAILVEHYSRQNGGSWALRDYSAIGDELLIESVGVAVPLARIYRSVEFDSGAEPVEPGGALPG